MDNVNVMPTHSPSSEALPDISIDCLVFGLDGGRLNVLLAQHRDGLGQGQWALPGGHIGRMEDLDGAASRILQDYVLLCIHFTQFFLVYFVIYD